MCRKDRGPRFRFVAIGCAALFAANTISGAECAFEFDDLRFVLASTSLDSLQEFVPEGESLEAWSSLIALRRSPEGPAPETYIQQLSTLYLADHPAEGISAHRNRVTGACALDFVLTGDTYIEWNFIRASVLPDGALLVSQFSRRFPFAQSPAEISTALHRTRTRLLPLLADAHFEVSAGFLPPPGRTPIHPPPASLARE